MAERPRVDPVAIVARLERGPVGKDGEAEAEIALATLDFLDPACRESGCDPGPTAHLSFSISPPRCSRLAQRATWKSLSTGCVKRLRRAPANCRRRLQTVRARSANTAVLVPVDAAGGELALNFLTSEGRCGAARSAEARCAAELRRGVQRNDES